MSDIERLLGEIDRDFAMTASSTGQSALEPRVRRALSRVPRERFVPDDLAVRAYDNRPLPIGHGQTISQPFIVALMTQLLRPQPDHTILEIGTGSGYQAAILAELVARVCSIEAEPSLAERAAQRLRDRGYDNVHVRCADGAVGWPEQAPYDGIIVTAAADELATAWLDQLAGNGRVVVPIGPPDGHQELQVITHRDPHRGREGKPRPDSQGHGSAPVRQSVLGVAFVPLRRASA